MTTVRLPIRDMGREAAESLLHAVLEKGNRRRQSFTPEIVVRSSTAPPA